MLVWDVLASGLTALGVTVLLCAVLGWRRHERRRWMPSGVLIFSLIFAGAWALGAWLTPFDGHPLSGLYWATYAVSALIVGLAVAAVLPQRVLQQSIERNQPVRLPAPGGQIGGILYWLVMTGLVVMIVRHYVM